MVPPVPMTEKRSTQRKEIRRHSVIRERYCSLRAVSFRNLSCMDQSVKIVDLSITGVGVECEKPLEEGIVWFKDSLYGQKCGHLVWQKQNGIRYRAGIEFISLSRFEEEYLREHVEGAEHGKSLHDPDDIISRVIAHLTNQQNPPVRLA